MELNLIRGDTYNLTFSLSDVSGNPLVLTSQDKCYFTVKKEFLCEECAFQKRFGAGITYNTETLLYEIKIESDDTCNLKCGTYKFDIKVKIGSKITKTILKGTLALSNNATHRGNE